MELECVRRVTAQPPPTPIMRSVAHDRASRARAPTLRDRVLTQIVSAHNPSTARGLRGAINTPDAIALLLRTTRAPTRRAFFKRGLPSGHMIVASLTAKPEISRHRLVRASRAKAGQRRGSIQ
jgi:hypothetical protein